MFKFLRGDKKAKAVKDTVHVSEQPKEKLMVHKIIELISNGAGQLDIENESSGIWQEKTLKFNNYKIIERDKIIDRKYDSTWINIIVFDKEKEFEVYESPELEYKVTNHGEILITRKHDNLANALEVKWNHQGPWCELITNEVNNLIQEIEISIEEEKKLQKTQELKSINENKDGSSTSFVNN